jgi:DNA primase
MTGAKDPDEFIKAKGADAFRALLEGSEDQVDYRLRTVTEQYDLSVDEQKVAFLKEATELVAHLPGAVERQVYAMRVAALAGLGADVVAQEVERRHKRLVSRAYREQERQQARPERQAQPAEKELRYDDPVSAMAEEGVIRLLYLDPELARRGALPKESDFSSEALRHIYSALRGRLDRGESVSTAGLGEVLSGPEMSLLVGILQRPEQLSRSEETLQDYIKIIQEQKDLREQKNAPPDFQAIIKLKREKGKRYEGNG